MRHTDILRHTHLLRGVKHMEPSRDLVQGGKGKHDQWISLGNTAIVIVVTVARLRTLYLKSCAIVKKLGWAVGWHH